MNILKYSPLKIGSYFKLPKSICKKQSLLNIKNRDEKCIKWCLIAALNPKEGRHPERVSFYKQFEHTIDDSGITYPTPLKEVGKLASQNSVRINVISYDEENKEFFPVLVDQSTNPSLPVITLLLLGGEHSTHYVLVKSLDALLRPENTRTQRFHCPRFVPHNLNYPSNYILLPRCFHGYRSKEGLDKHLENCVTRKVQGIRFPEDTHIEFKLYKKQVKCPVIIVCDFESYLENTSGGTSATRRTKHHKACSFAYKRVTPFEKFQKDLVLWRDDGVRDVADVFSKCTPFHTPTLNPHPSLNLHHFSGDDASRIQ